MAVLSPGINTQRLNKTFGEIGKLLSGAGKSVTNTSRVIFRNTKVKRDSFAKINLFKIRRAEYEKRKQLEDELEAPDNVKTPSGAAEKAQADTSKNFFDRLLGFTAYLTAGWLINNLPSIISMGTDFIGRIMKMGQIAGRFLQDTIRIFTGSFNVLGALFTNIASFDFFDTSKRLEKAFDGLNGTINDMGKQIDMAFRLVTKPLDMGQPPGQGAYEEQAPGVYTTAGLSGEAQKRIGNDAAFLGEVKRVSQKYGIKEGDLLGLIASESGFNPAAGKVGGHVGLIQFGVGEARSVGTSQEALVRMSRAEQMQYVDKYFETRGLKKGASAGQLYATIFAPAYANSNPNTVLYSSPSAAYRANAPLDTNKDGNITIAEMGGRIESKKREFGISDNISVAAQSSNVPGKGGKVIQYLTGDRTSPRYRADHAAGNYHDHLAFDSQATRDAAMRFLIGRGWTIGSVNTGRHAAGSYHYSNQAFDIPFYPNQSKKGVPDNAKGETALSSRLRADLIAGGFNGPQLSGGSVSSPSVADQIQSPQLPEISPSLTPDRKAMDLIVALSQQSFPDSNPPSSGGNGNIGSQPVSNFSMLNNFIKNKLLLDLAYL